jgi:hypothetical protein
VKGYPKDHSSRFCPLDAAPLRYFRAFFPVHALGEVAELTTAAGKVKINPSWHVNKGELLVFLGLWIRMTRYQLPNRGRYWSLEDDDVVFGWEKYMHKTKFDQIARVLMLSPDVDERDAIHRLFAATLAISEANAFHAFVSSHDHFQYNVKMTRDAWRSKLSNGLLELGGKGQSISRTVSQHPLHGHMSLVSLGKQARCQICRKRQADGRAGRTRMACQCGVAVCATAGATCFMTHISQVLGYPDPNNMQSCIDAFNDHGFR